MENNFNFEIFDSPKVSEQEIRQKQIEKAEKRAKNNKKNLTVKIISTAAAAIILLLAAMCTYLFAAPAHNPDRLIKTYINEINSGKWEKAYSRLCFGQKSAIYEDTFINFCNENPEAIAFTGGKIVDYDIEKDNESDNSPTEHKIFYSVNYVLEDGSNGTFYLTAVKTTAKAGKLAKYSVLPNQGCYASLKITVPYATEVRIGSIRFTEPEIENGNYVYNVDYAFARETDFHIKNPYCNEMEEFIELKPGLNTYNFTPEITEECYSNLCKQTEESITSLYTDIISGSEDFSKYKLSNAYRDNQFSNDIEEIKSAVFMGNYTVSDFHVEEAVLKKSFADINKQLNSSAPNEIEIKYDFKYSYKITYDGADGEPVSAVRTGNGYFGIKYILGNEWYINGISANAWF